MWAPADTCVARETNGLLEIRARVVLLEPIQDLVVDALDGGSDEQTSRPRKARATDAVAQQMLHLIVTS